MSYLTEEALRMPTAPEMPHIPASLNYRQKAHSLIRQKLREVRIPTQNGGPFSGSYGQLSFVINDGNFILPDMALDVTVTAVGNGTADLVNETMRLDQSGHSILKMLEVYANGVPVSWR
jgi:hypothetical protein